MWVECLSFESFILVGKKLTKERDYLKESDVETVNILSKGKTMFSLEFNDFYK